MKKSLSLVVAAAMTLTTASVAFADTAAPTTTDLTAQQKFDALKELGIFSGYPDGSAGLEKQMTRAEFAKVLTKLADLEENAAAAKVYTDVPAAHWAAGFIGASTEAKLMNGLGANKFGPSGQVTVEQIAKVADLLAGLEPIEGDVAGKVSGWAKGYVAAAIKAGLLPELPSYQTNATRELLVDVTYDLAADVVKVASSKVVDATHIEVTFSDGGVVKKELTTPLVNGTATKVSVDYNGKSYDVTVTLSALAATAAKQTGAKSITVNFNQAASDADKAALTYTLKFGLSSVTVTPKYADDNQSVVLSANYLPAGDYTLSVKGSDDIKLTTVAEKPSKIDITAPAVTNKINQDLGAKIFNQFGEAMTTAPSVTVYDITTPSAVITVNGSSADFSKANLNDTVSVTAVDPASGLSVNKTLKVINGSAATSIKIGQVQPLAGETRISTNEQGYVLPVTLVDQNGQAIKLPAQTLVDLKANGNTKDIGGLIFYVSDTNIISGIAVDSNGVVTLNTGANSGTAYITITNAATGANASTSVVVNPVASVNKFQLSHPGTIIVQNEDTAFPYTAVDTYDGVIAPTSVDLKNVSFVAPGLVNPHLNAKGELILNFSQTGTYTVSVFVNGILQPTTVQVTVNSPSKITSVSGVQDVATTYEVGAMNDVDTAQINVVDNYGRETDAAAGTFTVVPADKNIIDYVPAAGSVAGHFVAKKEGSTAVTIHSNANTGIVDYTFTVNVVKTADVKTYAIDTIGTLYGTTAVDNSAHGKAVTLVGKTASGASVKLSTATATPSFVSSLDESVLAVSGTAKTPTVVGQKAGKTTVTAYLNGSAVATQEVTVSDAAPVVKTVTFGSAEFDKKVGDADFDLGLTINDQYGYDAKAKPYQIQSSNSAVVTIAGGKAHIVGKGSATLTFIGSNNVTASAIVVVE